MSTEIKGDSNWNSDFATAVAIYTDRKTAGTDGGTATAGSWFTRVLNTEEADPQAIGSLTSNEVTLQAGAYIISWEAPGFKVGRYTSRLFNVTDASVVMEGCTEVSDQATSDVASRSCGKVYLVLASAKAIRVEQRVTTTQGTNGLGLSTNFQDEIYTVLTIQKVKS